MGSEMCIRDRPRSMCAAFARSPPPCSRRPFAQVPRGLLCTEDAAANRLLQVHRSAGAARGAVAALDAEFEFQEFKAIQGEGLRGLNSELFRTPSKHRVWVITRYTQLTALHGEVLLVSLVGVGFGVPAHELLAITRTPEIRTQMQRLMTIHKLVRARMPACGCAHPS